MEKLENITVKTLYREILKAVRTYPSKNRQAFRQAIIEDVHDWKKITDEDKKAQAIKKMKMLYGHLTMWNVKMNEVNRVDTDKVNKTMPYGDINKK